MLYNLMLDKPVTLFRLMSNGSWISPVLNEITVTNNQVMFRFMGPYWLRFTARTEQNDDLTLDWNNTLPSVLTYLRLRQFDFSDNALKVLTDRWSTLEITGQNDNTVLWDVEESHDTFWYNMGNRVRGENNIANLIPGKPIT